MRASSNVPARHPGRMSSWGLAAVCVLALSVALIYYALTANMRPLPFNSDLLYPLSVMRDLTLRHEPLSGWSLTPAPYLFPDLPLFALLYKAGFTGPAVFDVYLDVFAVLVMASVVGVGVTLRRPSAAMLVGALFLVVVARAEVGEFVFQVGYHGGANLMMLASLGALILWVGKPRQGMTPHLYVYIACCALGVMSDMLTIFHSALPLFLSVLYVKRHEMTRHKVAHLFGLLFLSPVVLGLSSRFLFTLISGVRIPAGLAAHKIPQRIFDGTYWSGVGAGLLDNIVSSPAAALLLGVAWAYGVVKLRGYAKRMHTSSPGESLLLAFGVCAPVILLLVCVLTTQYSGSAGLRYLTGAFLIASMNLVLLWPQRRRHQWIVAALCTTLSCGALMVLLTSGAEIEAFPRERFKQLPKVTCFEKNLEDHGLRHGAADYWDAKFLMELVERPGLRVVSLDMKTLTPKDWIQNACWHLDEQGEVLPVEFVIIRDEQVTGAWPELWREQPMRKESCPGFEILIFETPISFEMEVLESKAGLARCEG